MTYTRIADLERLGFRRIHTGRGLHGDRLWWKRTGTEMSIVRQRDGLTKCQDLSGMHQAVCPPDTQPHNRAWAIALAADTLTDWRA